MFFLSGFAGVPTWFYILAFIVVIIFIIVAEWISRS